jgi:hypothetical protein
VAEGGGGEQILLNDARLIVVGARLMSVRRAVCENNIFTKPAKSPRFNYANKNLYER